MEMIRFSLKNLRKLVAVVVLILAFGSVTMAQSDANGGLFNGMLSVGAKVGFNVSQFEQPSSIFGLNAGAFGRYELLDFLQVQLEVLYSQQGGGRENYFRDYDDLFNYNGFNVEGKQVYNRSVRFHLVETPLVARLTLPELKESFVTPRLLLGGSFGYAFAAYETRDEQLFFDASSTNLGEINPNSIVFSNQRENVGGDYDQKQFGAIGGIALDFNSETKPFFIEFRYRYGLNQLSNQEYTVLNNGPNGGQVNASTFSINFGMSILNF